MQLAGSARVGPGPAYGDLRASRGRRSPLPPSREGASGPHDQIGIKAQVGAHRPHATRSPRWRRLARSDLGDSASDGLLGAAEIRTPAFRRSDRAGARVRAVAAISVPAGWGPTHASTR
jgi:hypothetical protein